MKKYLKTNKEGKVDYQGKTIEISEAFYLLTSSSGKKDFEFLTEEDAGGISFGDSNEVEDLVYIPLKNGKIMCCKETTLEFIDPLEFISDDSFIGSEIFTKSLKDLKLLAKGLEVFGDVNPFHNFSFKDVTLIGVTKDERGKLHFYL